MREEEALVSVMAMIILAGAALMYAAMVNRRRIREMEHRERLAMIERGMAPVPERLPTGSTEPARAVRAGDSASASRFRTAGIVLMGIGLGLFFLIAFAAGAPGVGLGVGGAWAVIGAALLYNYHLLAQREADAGPTSSWAPSRPTPPPAEPPDNIAP